jgi:hypothetical protein
MSETKEEIVIEMSFQGGASKPEVRKYGGHSKPPNAYKKYCRCGCSIGPAGFFYSRQYPGIDPGPDGACPANYLGDPDDIFCGSPYPNNMDGHAVFITRARIEALTNEVKKLRKKVTLLESIEDI